MASSLFDDDYSSNYSSYLNKYNRPSYTDIGRDYGSSYRDQTTLRETDNILNKGLLDSGYSSNVNDIPITNNPLFNVGEDSFLTRFERSYCSLSLRESVRLALEINVPNLLTVIAFILFFTFIVLPETDDGSQYYLWGIALGCISYLFFVTIFKCYLG